MEPILWAVSSLIGLLLLVVLLLGLVGISIWLLRWICRVWRDGSTGGRRPLRAAGDLEED